jgi:hypothetical protein
MLRSVCVLIIFAASLLFVVAALLDALEGVHPRG